MFQHPLSEFYPIANGYHANSWGYASAILNAAIDDREGYRDKFFELVKEVRPDINPGELLFKCILNSKPDMMLAVNILNQAIEKRLEENNHESDNARNL